MKTYGGSALLRAVCVLLTVSCPLDSCLLSPVSCLLDSSPTTLY